MTDGHDRLIGRMAGILAGLHDVESSASRLCEAGRQMLGAEGAALTVRTSLESVIVVAATDELAQQLEDLQEVVGEGPSRDAFLEGSVQVADFTDDAHDRWSVMHEHGRRVGFGGRLVAVPLRPFDESIGTLTAHRHDRSLDVDPVAANFLGLAIGTALVQDARLGVEGDILDEAWASRAQIHQATGMIISQVGVRPEEAMALLRGQAFANDTTLLEVARQIVERRINFRNFTIEGD